MAQIRSKQIADFLQTVDFATLNDATKIASGLAVKNYVSAQIATVNGNTGDLVASVDSLEVALAAEISATNDDFAVVNESVESLEQALAAEIQSTNDDFAVVNESVESLEQGLSLEKGRIDAILLASDADKDSFAEIVSLINAVDTTNDDALATVIGNLNAEISATNADVTSINTRATNIEALNTAQNESIDSLEVALNAEISATNSDVTSIDARLGEVSGDLVGSVDSLELALSAEISATDADFTSVNTRVSNDEAALAAEIVRAESVEAVLDGRITSEVSDLNVTIDSLETAHDSRLDSLEAYIMEDFEVVEESKAGNGLSYTLGFAVQDDNKTLVNAFVNGHRVLVNTVSGTSIALVTPGYEIDEDDTVVFVYQK